MGYPVPVLASLTFIGMINNFQRDAGLEDDRDSGSVSLISTLEQGDQVRNKGLLIKVYYALIMKLNVKKTNFD